MITKIKNHFPGKVPIEETEKLFIYLLEVGSFLSEATGTERISIIYDREGFDSNKNFDSSVINLMKKVMQIL